MPASLAGPSSAKSFELRLQLDGAKAMFFWRWLTLPGRTMKDAEANPVAIDSYVEFLDALVRVFI
jgi:hypothetical protein